MVMPEAVAGTVVVTRAGTNDDSRTAVMPVRAIDRPATAGHVPNTWHMTVEPDRAVIAIAMPSVGFLNQARLRQRRAAERTQGRC